MNIYIDLSESSTPSTSSTDSSESAMVRQMAAICRRSWWLGKPPIDEHGSGTFSDDSSSGSSSDLVEETKIKVAALMARLTLEQRREVLRSVDSGLYDNNGDSNER